MDGDSHILEIQWSASDLTGLPTRVGPFGTAAEAEQWAKLNAPRAICEVATLAYPYLRSEDGSEFLIDLGVHADASTGGRSNAGF